MPFDKGNKLGNRTGRPKGSANKETKIIRDWIGQFLNGHIHLIEEDILALKPKDRIQALTNLMEYAVPKLNRTDVNVDTKKQVIIQIGSTRDNQTPEPTLLRSPAELTS